MPVLLYIQQTQHREFDVPHNKKTIQRIYKIKSREISKSFPILAFSKDVVEKIEEFDKNSEKNVVKSVNINFKINRREN